jgi:hypothetical protein
VSPFPPTRNRRAADQGSSPPERPGTHELDFGLSAGMPVSAGGELKGSREIPRAALVKARAVGMAYFLED